MGLSLSKSDEGKCLVFNGKSFSLCFGEIVSRNVMIPFCLIFPLHDCHLKPLRNVTNFGYFWSLLYVVSESIFCVHVDLRSYLPLVKRAKRATN